MLVVKDVFVLILLQVSLHSLMATLSTSNPYFIRCIKPNTHKVSALTSIHGDTCVFVHTPTHTPTHTHTVTILPLANISRSGCQTVSQRMCVKRLSFINQTVLPHPPPADRNEKRLALLGPFDTRLPSNRLRQ